MNRSLRWPICVLPLALVLGATGSAHADSPPEAEQLYNVGQGAFDGKQYSDAIAAWERSYSLSNEPGLLFNIGQAYRLRAKSGDCTRASDAYKKFIAYDPSSEQRSEAEALVAKLRDCVTHEATNTSTTGPIAHRSITPAVETPNAPMNDARGDSPEHPGRTKKFTGMAIAGGGLLLAATGVYFGRKAASLDDEVTAACVEMGLIRSRRRFAYAAI